MPTPWPNPRPSNVNTKRLGAVAPAARTGATRAAPTASAASGRSTRMRLKPITRTGWRAKASGFAAGRPDARAGASRLPRPSAATVLGLVVGAVLAASDRLPPVAPLAVPGHRPREGLVEVVRRRPPERAQLGGVEGVAAGGPGAGPHAAGEGVVAARGVGDAGGGGAVSASLAA